MTRTRVFIVALLIVVAALLIVPEATAQTEGYPPSIAARDR